MSENLNLSADAEYVPFSVHPRAIKELGERLVTDDFVAISELVKNSYDAMATEVIIRFGSSTTGNFIEVEDDGDGMSLEILKSVWTQLFTPYKKILKLQNRKRKRSLSGDKGIGRLSAARLGGELEVYTQTKNEDCYALLLDWSKFTSIDENDSIDDLVFDDFTVAIDRWPSTPFNKKHGTLIRISNLKKKDWLDDQDSVDQLKKELARIRPPLRKSDDFVIKLEHPLLNDGEVTNVASSYPKFLDYPHYFYKGKISKQGLEASISINKRYVQKSEKIEKEMSEMLEEDEQFICGDFEFEFRVWDLDANSVGDISDQFDLQKRQIREWIKLNRGVSLYRDEILVLPKTSGIDWLNLEQRRVSRIGDRISMNNIISFVDISSKGNPDLVDTADRETLERNSASDQFNSLLLEAISILEIIRKKYKATKEDAYSFRFLLENEQVEDSIQNIRHTLSTDGTTDSVLKLVDKLGVDLKKRDDLIKDRLGYYSRLASVGTIASYVVHEVRNSSVAIGACNRDGRNLLEACNSEKKGLVKKRLDTSDKALASLETLAHAILPLSGAKFQRKTNEFVSLHGIFASCLEANSKLISKREIQIVNETKNDEVGVSEGELFILLQNLLQNAIHWVSKKKSTDRIIKLGKLKRQKESLVFTFEDSGPGIDQEYSDVIFLPGVSARPDGTGMGLTVVAEICEKYRGHIEIVESSLGGAAFEITLPRKV